jgi:RimJ/RimL family protein N-acetyltransferase
MPISVREARVEDAAHYLEYLKVLFAETDIDIPVTPPEFTRTLDEQRQKIQDYLEADNSVLILAFDEEGRIVGELNLDGGDRLATRHCCTLGMSVHRASRGRGIGSLLMKAALDWARQNPVIKRVELQTYARNTHAQALYQKFGFELEGIRKAAIYQDEQYLDDLMMGLVLDK